MSKETREIEIGDNLMWLLIILTVIIASVIESVWG